MVGCLAGEIDGWMVRGVGTESLNVGIIHQWLAAGTEMKPLMIADLTHHGLNVPFENDKTRSQHEAQGASKKPN